MNLIGDLRWRGMIHDSIPGIEEKLAQAPRVVYAGFDPTAESLQIGNLVPIMLLMHFQRAGHKPIALVGGATGMVGDPSGKSEERVLQTKEAIQHNLERFRGQLEKFLIFGSGDEAAEIVNNYDWFKDFKFLDFLRDVGKHITVNYMLAKDSVKQRMESGLSFTEFSYQLLQGYDFYRLYCEKNCTIQVGGSDQWGNIVTGTELVRRKAGGEAYALTCPLLTKADGAKFGKSAAGEKIWLDPNLTSAYKFYQFWLNCSDEDVGRFIKIFSMRPREEIAALIEEHEKTPHIRTLQKALAEEITERVHSAVELRKAQNASQILFGKGTTDQLRTLSERELLDVFEGVPQFAVTKQKLAAGIPLIDLISKEAAVFGSKGEARRMIKGGGVSVNKKKAVGEDTLCDAQDLLNGKYLLIQKGKKNYYLITTA
ncbi:MAG: tyrosine--tRNA ligase [Chitinivibrionales bacterium]|nr:tyrosine--tRNA ligase [Chitinivibrionales bacterium]